MGQGRLDFLPFLCVAMSLALSLACLFPGPAFAVPLGIETAGPDHTFGFGVDFRYQTRDLKRDSYRRTTSWRTVLNSVGKPPGRDVERAFSRTRMGLAVVSMKFRDYLDPYLLLGGVRMESEHEIHANGTRFFKEEFVSSTGLAGGFGIKGMIFDIPFSDPSLPSGLNFHFDLSYLQYQASLAPHVEVPNGPQESFKDYYRSAASDDIASDYRLNSYEGNLKLLASAPWGPLVPYTGLSLTRQRMVIEGEVADWQSGGLTKIHDRYVLVNRHLLSPIVGMSWHITPDLRANLEGEGGDGWDRWNATGGLAYFF